MFFEYRDYVRDSGQYQDMLQAMKQEVEEFYHSFHDDPRLLSGWGHGFFCPEDGGRLVYDRESPLRHRCSICGKEYTDFKYSMYFVTMYRNEAVGVTVKAAVLYQIFEKPEYLDIVKNIIGFYAENYKYFAVHAKDKINCENTVDVGGVGKIMPQGLNEAVIAIRFINAMEVVKASLDPLWVAEIKKKLFVPMYQMLRPQKMHIHNIPLWINSAFGTMGLFFQEEAWVKEAVSAPYNIREQLDQGVTESGFWYEGSIHYNFFALEGLVTFLAFAKEYDCDLGAEYMATVKKMLFVAYDYAFDNDVFPNPSDGWPNISLQTYMHVYCMGYQLFGQEILPLLVHIADNKRERGRLPLSEPYYYENKIPLAQLMYAADFREYPCGQPPKRRSCNFEDYNCAILRSKDINVFLKYGHETKSHAHPDKMNVEIVLKDSVFTKDLSNSGYGTELCNGWHRTIAAHNTCAMDGKPTDVESQGRMLLFQEDCVEAEAKAYEDTIYRRRISMEGDRIHDCFTVDAGHEGVIDWFFHFEDAVETEELQVCEEQVDPGMFAEYRYMMDVRELIPDRCLEGSSIVLKNQVGSVKIMLEEGSRIYLAKTYNNPADRMRDTVIIRKKDSHAVFCSTITIV